MNKSECLYAIQQAEELIATLREILDGNDWDGPQAFMETVHDCQHQLNRALHAAIVPALNLAAPEQEEPAFITEGEPAADLPAFVDMANVRSLYDWKPGESLDEAIARKKPQEG